MNKKKNHIINKLNFLELRILLEHIRLGKDHLEKYLTNAQLERLLGYGELSNNQYADIKPDPLERKGNFMLMLNTIFTCILGAWLAAIGFMGVGLGPYKIQLLFITCIAALIGGYFGYTSFKKTYTDAKDAVTNQKLNNLQLVILELMRRKRKIIIRKIITYLNNTLLDINKNEKKSDLNTWYDFSSKKDILDWLNQFDNLISTKIKSLSSQKAYSICCEQITNIQSQLKKSLKKNIKKIEPKTQHREDKRKKNNSFIKVLTNPTIAIPKEPVITPSWLKNNFFLLLSGLIPTALGGFGSLFVYFGGLPALAKEFGIFSIENILKEPEVKILVFSIAIGITLYFAYSFIHANRKSFKRDQELRKTYKLITNQESTLLELNAKLNILRKTKQHLKNVIRILIIVEEISYYLKS